MEKNKKNMTDADLDNPIDTNDLSVEELNISAETDCPENGAGEEIIQKLKEELEEQKDKYVRLFAEFENYKRRTSKERIELIQTAGKEVIVSCLLYTSDAA